MASGSEGYRRINKTKRKAKLESFKEAKLGKGGGTKSHPAKGSAIKSLLK